MAKIVTVKQMQEIEKAADVGGLTYDMMMENAGRSIAEAILNVHPQMQGKRVLILAGSGNNGGDGLVVGHYLCAEGADVTVIFTKERDSSDQNYERLKEDGAKFLDYGKQRTVRKAVSESDILIDAVLGTGFRLPLGGSAKDVLEIVGAHLKKIDSSPWVVAVDCPSGLDCDTGEVADECLRADLTVTLAAVKPGLILSPGIAYTGELIVGDIGIEENHKLLRNIKREFATNDMIHSLLPDRPRDGHKGTFGAVMIVGGSSNYPGAPGLAGLGAYRSGCGLVTLALPNSLQGCITPLLPEATWLLLPHELGAISANAAEILHRNLEKTSCLLLGPGIGLEKSTYDFVDRLIASEGDGTRDRIGFQTSEMSEPEKTATLPTSVVDADGLKILASFDDWMTRLPKVSILTPHPGEMATLTGMSVSDIQMSRMETALKYAKQWGHIVVLKGAHTIVAGHDERCMVMPFATSALAHAGTGDVLAGSIAAFCAQGLEPYDAAVVGTYLHGYAGVLATEAVGDEAGVLAGEVANAIPEAMLNLRRM